MSNYYGGNPPHQGQYGTPPPGEHQAYYGSPPPGGPGYDTRTQPYSGYPPASGENKAYYGSHGGQPQAHHGAPLQPGTPGAPGGPGGPGEGERGLGATMLGAAGGGFVGHK